MAKYTINTRIMSNVAASKLFYDLKVYKRDGQDKEHVLLSVTKQPFTADYKTQPHVTNEMEDDLSVIYMMDIMLYREHGGKLHPVLRVPSTKMYTLREMVSGEAFSDIKRENVCYFEAKTETRPVNENGKDNIHSVQITCYERAFIAKQYPVGDPLDPFEKSKIDAQIASRMNYSSYPDQGDTSLCGPASLFFSLQKDRPEIYKQAARELWMYGKTKINKLVINPCDGCRHPEGPFYDNKRELISGLDWMTLASLRDSSNSMMNYNKVDDEVSGITAWGELSGWFEMVGYKKVHSDVGFISKGMDSINKLNFYMEKGCRVVALVNASLINGRDMKIAIPNHWVVWQGPLIINANGSIEQRVFSWGDRQTKIEGNKGGAFYTNRFFGALVFEPLK
ncbi:hypothetical protein RJ495_002587 [Pluralibacter gergoviae]|nr:hypothetical protein [Pluralibacter gergoviae]